MRHGKSSWKDPALADRERPLKKRGKKNSTLMGEWIRQKKELPELILCSPAVRTRQTAGKFIEASHYKGKIEYCEALYLAEEATILSLLSELPEDIKRVMIIAHNPGLGSLFQMLSGNVNTLPTAGVVGLDLQLDTWSEIGPNSQAEVLYFKKATDLKPLEK